MTDDERPRETELIGLIPAAGLATRIAPLPCSKEIYPIGFGAPREQRGSRPKVVSQDLLEKMRRAGVTRAFIILKTGKWDIPGYFCGGEMVDMNLAYLVLGSSSNTPYTLDEAYPYVARSSVAFGFPDIVFQADDAFVRLVARKADSKACAVLGLFPAEHSDKVDMVDCDGDGRIREIVTKPARTHLFYSWCVAVWTPVFTQFLHEYVRAHKPTAPASPETSVGQVIQAAIGAGLSIEGVPVSDRPYLDIGTATDLARAITIYST